MKKLTILVMIIALMGGISIQSFASDIPENQPVIMLTADEDPDEEKKCCEGKKEGECCQKNSKTNHECEENCEGKCSAHAQKHKKECESKCEKEGNNENG